MPSFMARACNPTPFFCCLMVVRGDPQSPVPNPAARPRGASWTAIGVGLTALIVAAVVILAATLSSMFSGFNPGRRHLRAIPISASACVYVRVMHAAANEVQRDEPILALDVGATGDPLTLGWPRSRPRFAHALGTLELA